jgi:formyl-CoA transferase
MSGSAGPLAGLTVIDTATLFAGPLAATVLGDLGADVIKLEHPQLADPARVHGESKDGIGLWWKMLSRNKRTITLNLGRPAGKDVFLRLAADADVVIENFRPGTFERWGLGYPELAARNPRLVLAHVSGFGRTGPLSSRAGFGTLAEAMSGFAAITGQPDGPPTLPPFGLADGVSALVLAIGILAALRSREASGRGQELDVALIEPLLTLLGPQPTVYDQLGVVQQRTGNRTTSTAPRNTYRSRDGVWLAVSASTLTVAQRLLRLVGRADLTEEPWFESGYERARHGDLLDEVVGGWIGERDAEQVIAAFEEVEAAVAPVLDIAGITSHPQYQALESLVTVEDEDLGPILMQNLMVRLSGTPGSIRWTGRALGEDNDEVLGAAGVGPEELERLREEGVV